MCKIMKRRHLRLVSSKADIEKTTFKEIITDYFADLFISKNEKIYILKDVLNNIYRDYEITTGINDIPYFVKAENKLKQIVLENKINYYYNRLKKFKKRV